MYHITRLLYQAPIQSGELTECAYRRDLLYGSDTPYTPDIACTALSGGLDHISFLSDEEKQLLFTGNAVNLIPRLSGILQVKVSGNSVCYKENPITGKDKRNRRIRTIVAKIYGHLFSWTWR